MRYGKAFNHRDRRGKTAEDAEGLGARHACVMGQRWEGELAAEVCASSKETKTHKRWCI